MSHARLAPLLLAAVSALAALPAVAADGGSTPLQLAQVTPEEDQKAKKARKAEEKEERREKKSERKEKQKETKEERKGERREDRDGRKNERFENKKERVEEKKERGEDKPERVEDRKERVEDKKERGDDRKEEARRKRDEVIRLRAEEKARREELGKQKREAERVRRQQEDDKRREVFRERAVEPRRDPDRDDRRDVKRDDSPPPTEAPAVRAADPVVTPEGRRKPRRQEIRENYRRAERPNRSFDDLKRNRRERTISEGKLRVIEEPDRRVIVKQNNRTFIRHDESERFRRIAPDARTIRRSDGSSTTFMTRKGGVRIYDVTDRHGRLLNRYRRYPSGREVILIDNRRHYSRDKNRTRDVLIGAGIGLFIGSAIALAAPEVRIPRDEYIVDYGRASDDDLYDALTAPPIERLDRGYSLDEVRYSRPLRDRMRRIDLDTVTFEFGSWEVGPDQSRALDRLADGIMRVLERNADEIIMIEGHTDAVGSQDDNLTLSDRRAQSVAEILTTEYGVPPENLVTQGYGEEHLKIATDGPERLNRRIAVRTIGPLLSGKFEDDRYSGPAPAAGPYDDEPPGDDRYDARR
jgi:outer membrane protein OmpA-like peptidoglycan-associated protein